MIRAICITIEICACIALSGWLAVMFWGIQRAARDNRARLKTPTRVTVTIYENKES